MHFARMSFFRSSKRVSVWPMAMVLGLGACGSQGSADRSSVKNETNETFSALSFESWCDSWAILCESEPSPVPAPITLDGKTWTAITNVATEALNNPITFNVTRAEVDSPQLAQAFEKLGLTSELNEFKTSLDNAQWQSLGLEGKSIVSRASAQGRVDAANGLSFESGTALSLSLGANSSIAVNGLSLSSAAVAQPAPLTSISLGEGNSLNFALGEDTVQNVPITFLEDTLLSAFGVEDAATEATEFTTDQIISAAYPLLSWANKPQRTVSLNRKFFSVAGTELKPVLDGEDFGPAVLNALSALDSLAISATAGRNVAQITQVSGAKLECNINNGEAKVTLDREFGLKRFYQVDGGIGLEFYGVKASARLALGIPLTLKRIELRGNKVTILDIPIIGKIDVDLDQLGGSGEEETVFACVK